MIDPTRSLIARFTVLTAMMALAACAGRMPVHVAAKGDAPHRTATRPVAPASPAPWDAAPKIGKPYQVLGHWYVPADDPAYDQTGIASWYGPGFHALSTANGETYDQDGLSAAHKTLPLPCYVEVENLDNGRRLMVRVNDRGPFVDGRILDLSRRSAQLLGVDGPGTAHVRVRRIVPDAATIAALRPPASAPTPVLAAASLASPPRVATAPAIAASAVVTPADRIAVAVEHTVAPVAPAGAGPLIQVAAVSDAGRASWLVGYLSQFGPARVETTPGGLHRVRLGPFASRNDAEATLSLVHAAGYGEAWIVALPVLPAS